MVTILGKYAIDKGLGNGAELAQEIGTKALDKAREMFTLVLDRLRRKPDGEFVSRKFEESPGDYEKPMQTEVSKELSADAEFAAQLKALMAEYEEALREHAAQAGENYKATLKGEGAIAQGPGAVAAGAGGIAVGGDVHGDVTTGARGKDADES